MADYRIECKTHDKDGVITAVGVLEHTYPVQQVVDWIRSGAHTFHTLEQGLRANVRARQHPLTGRWFLESTADGFKYNNLDYLPDCQIRS